MKNTVLLIALMTLVLCTTVYSQIGNADSSMAVTDTLSENFGLFTKDDLLILALRFDMKEYIRKKPKEEYMNGILTYYVSEKDSINKEIRLKSRGEFRNGYCSFPPLKLNFRKSGFKMEDIKKIGSIKLVTHCQSGNEEYLFKEYLVYKLYNVLTDYSFRVRLTEIDYISTTQKSKTIRSYAFFIEPLEILAERIKTVPVTNPALTQKNIIPQMMDRVALFNYMIGNTDWAVPGQHNCKVLSGTDFSQPGLGIIVPYDFDYCGLVDAHYAIPAEGLNIDNVRQRIYQGLCRTEKEFTAALKEFIDKKSEFYKVINDFRLLDEKSKKQMVSYLDEFFNSAERGNSILYNLTNQCKSLE